MPKTNAAFYSFNRGEVGKHALGRVDIEHLRLAAEEQQNFMPLVIGPMTLRPGLAFIGETKSSARAKLVPFIFAKDDTALLELTSNLMRVWVNDTLVTRPSVSTAITSGDFSSGTGWTLTLTPNDGNAGAAAISSGQLALQAFAKGAIAACKQQVTVAGADQGKVHRLRIVTRGPVTFMCGSSEDGDQYIRQTVLEEGSHSLAFTPTGNFHVRFETNTPHKKLVDSITVEASGTFELPTPWTEADLPNLRLDQSGDVIFVACKGLQPRRIERRANGSWSIVKYHTQKGPFTLPPQSAHDVLMSVPVNVGTDLLTASRPFFKPEHVGQIIRLNCKGQNLIDRLAGADQFTEAIRLFGVGNDNDFTWTRSGTWSGQLTLQRSYDGPDSGFVDVSNSGSNGWNLVTPGGSFDNVVHWYRVGFKSGEYTSGCAVVAFSYKAGGGIGLMRIVEYVSPTQARVDILNILPDIAPTKDWLIGEWGDDVGWPSAVTFHDGRLWWAGRDRIWGSVSDDFHNFDVDKMGDAAPISRSMGSGPIAFINWLLSLARLIAGREMSETSIRSSSFDEPITPTQFTARDCSTQGAARVPALKVDSRGIFVQQSKRKVYELSFQAERADYGARDLTRLNLDIGVPALTGIAVQRQPDTRLHFVRSDGQAPNLLYDVNDTVEAWWRVVTDGAVEEVAVLPGDLEDRVYYVINRTINGQAKRYIERMTRLDECRGGSICRLADSHILYQGTPISTLTGLSHLEGKTVVVWADGKDVGTKTVSSGQITLAIAASNIVAGLSYEGRFKSAKLAYAAGLGTALTQPKKISKLGLLLADTHYQGLRYGTAFDQLEPLPLIEGEKPVAADTVWPSYDAPMVEVMGSHSSDTRLCLTAAAPRPCTVMAAVVGIETHDKV